jgi:hypothetical protein
VYEGKVVWEHIGVDGGRHPGSVHLKEGESVQEYVNKMNQKLGEKFFLNTPQLPKYLAKPVGAVGFGYSRVTPTGLVDEQPPANP